MSMTDTVLDTALTTLEGLGDVLPLAGYGGSTEKEIVERTISQLLPVPGVLEYAISSLSDRVFKAVKELLRTTFPKSSPSFAGSIHASMLSVLSNTLTDVLPDDILETAHLDECWSAVVLARPVVKEITKLSRKGTWKREDVCDKSFVDIDVATPSTPAELREIEGSVLNDQQQILIHYLMQLRHPTSSQLFQAFYITRKRESAKTASSAVITAPPAASSSQSPQKTEVADVPGSRSLNPLHSVTPIKAALYFKTVDGFGDWFIHFTKHAITGIRQLHNRAPALYDLVIDTVRNLSKGHFSFKYHIPVTDAANAVPIYKARVNGDLRLVYQIYCMLDPVAPVERQAIRVFGIYDHAQMNRLGSSYWEDIARDCGGQGDASSYRRRCRERNQHRDAGDSVFIPLTFPRLAVQDTVTHEPFDIQCPILDASTLLEMHRVVVFSKALLNSFLADCDVDFLMQPSETEKEIIEHSSSCFVIGRSGTGKTYSIIYKMVALERAWALEEIDDGLQRQMFVTRSPALARQVRVMYEQLMRAFRLERLTQEELEVLSGTPFSGAPEAALPLPRRWSELRKEHFPLFVTFDEVCSMLEADGVSRSSGDSALPTPRAGEEDDGVDDHDAGTMLDISQPSVSCHRFVSAYWPHLPQKLRAQFKDPVSVFSEFLGVIKGSEETTKSKTMRGYLDHETYLEFSHKAQPTFALQRAPVYQLFKAYTKLLRDRRERDDADRTHKLLEILRCNDGVPGQPVDYLYVDEAQDNLMIDLRFLRELCHNPNGLFWAGDTAQTIVSGSSFTFPELKSMMYRVEEGREDRFRSISPRTFHLALNYRSHTGIANCAQTVIDLIGAIMPSSIDRLGPERGWRGGPKPVFFGRHEDNDMSSFMRQFIQGELGAEQCIIVRDEAERLAFLSHNVVGGLVITIPESKGLEFNDVLLYNFFQSSSLTERLWSIVSMSIEEKSLEDARCPSVCRELKFLYVALTRARNRLWIIDGVQATPMIGLWQRRDQIQTHHMAADSDSSLRAFSSDPSSSQEWAEKGKTFMDKRNFRSARYCFERASQPLLRHIAHALLLQEEADTRDKFFEAAQALSNCADTSHSAAERHDLMCRAARCFSHAQKFASSAEMYLGAGLYTEAAQELYNGSMMDDARQIMLEHKVADSVATYIRLHFFRSGEPSKAIETFTSGTTFTAGTKKATAFMRRHGLYHDLAAHLEQLEQYSGAADVYENHLSDVPAAIDLRFRVLADKETCQRGATLLLTEFWSQLSFSSRIVDISRPNTYLSKLIPLASVALSSSQDIQLSRNAIDELSMFVSIQQQKADDLLNIGLRLLSTQSCDAATLSLDYAFTFLLDQLASLDNTTQILTPSFLKSFTAYVRLLMEYRNTRSWRAYGIKKAEGKQLGLYFLPEGTFLSKAAIHHRIDGAKSLKPGKQNAAAALLISTSSLHRLLRISVGSRVRHRVEIVSKLCRELPIVKPCVLHAFSGGCPGYDAGHCDWQHDGGPHPLTSKGLHERLRTYCHLILASGYVDPGTDDSDSEAKKLTLWRERLHWMKALANCVCIAFFELGSRIMFNQNLIPEWDATSQVLRRWICEILFAACPPKLHPPQLPKELRLSAIPCAALLSYMLDRLRDSSALKPLPGPSYWYAAIDSRIALEDLRDFSATDKGNDAKMPGALLYLSFMLRIVEGAPSRSFHSGIAAHLAEGLCHAFIMTSRGKKQSGLHSLVLVRGWLHNLLPLFNLQPEGDVVQHRREHVRGLLGMFPEILQRLSHYGYSAEHKVAVPEAIISDVRCLGMSLTLLGYWHHELKPETDKQKHIVDVLGGALSKEILNLVFRNYIDGGWEQLKKWLWWSVPPSSSGRWDQLVRVRDKNIPDESRGAQRTTVSIVYSSLEDLEALLAIKASTPTQAAEFPPQWLEPKQELHLPQLPADIDSAAHAEPSEKPASNGDGDTSNPVDHAKTEGPVVLPATQSNTDIHHGAAIADTEEGHVQAEAVFLR